LKRKGLKRKVETAMEGEVWKGRFTFDHLHKTSRRTGKDHWSGETGCDSLTSEVMDSDDLGIVVETWKDKLSCDHCTSPTN
jgi:hypothetical protein